MMRAKPTIDQPNTVANSRHCHATAVRPQGTLGALECLPLLKTVVLSSNALEGGLDPLR